MVLPGRIEGRFKEGKASMPSREAKESDAFARASDEELVRAFQAGEGRDACFEELVARYGARTFAFFARRVGDREHASDLNQELYLALYQHLDGFRLESRFTTWLFRIARSALSRLRRRWRVHLDERPDEVSARAWEALGIDERDPLDEVESARRRDALTRCLARLAEIERRVVLGQYLDGETLDGLGRRLALDNPSGARAPLIAAQRKLRRCLEAAGVHGSSS